MFQLPVQAGTGIALLLHFHVDVSVTAFERSLWLHRHRSPLLGLLNVGTCVPIYTASYAVRQTLYYRCCGNPRPGVFVCVGKCEHVEEGSPQDQEGLLWLFAELRILGKTILGYWVRWWIILGRNFKKLLCWFEWTGSGLGQSVTAINGVVLMSEIY